MPDYENAERTRLTTDTDPSDYAVANRDGIIQMLRRLSKKPDILTAYFDGGSRFILTAVLDVMRERGLVVLDVGPDENATARCVAAERVLCTTRHQGVTVRFTCRALQRARFQGQPALAAPLPEEMLYLQRRQVFRVPTPTIEGPKLELTAADGGTYRLTVVDLSSAGVGLIDEGESCPIEPPDTVEQCRLILPERGSIELDISVRYRRSLNRDGRREATRLGARFERMDPRDNLVIQRYVNELQAQMAS